MLKVDVSGLTQRLAQAVQRQLVHTVSLRNRNA